MKQSTRLVPLVMLLLWMLLALPAAAAAPETTVQQNGIYTIYFETGGGAIIALAAGAAAVAVAVGVVTTVAPVAVRGRVELEDHTVPANARISLLQDGKVVAQTRTQKTAAAMPRTTG